MKSREKEDAQVPARPLASVAAFGTSQGLAMVMGLLMQVMAARNLLPADYARFVVANTVVLALTLGLTSAVPKALVRRISIDPSRVGEVWRTIGRVHLPICIAVAFLLWVGGASLPSDPRLAIALKLASLELVVRAGFLEPAWSVLNGMRRHRTQAALMLAHSVFRVLWLAVFLHHDLDGGEGTLAGCVLSLAAASLTSCVVVIPFVSRTRRSKGHSDQPKTRVSVNKELVKWIRMAPVAEILNYLVVASNLWFLKLISNDVAGVGVYAACLMLAQSVIPFGNAVSRGLFSTFASLLREGRVSEVAALLRIVLRGVFVTASCAVSVAFVQGSSIVSMMFGANFQDSESLLGILMVGTFGVAIVWLLGDVLNAAGRLRGRMIAMMVLGVFAGIACGTLIPVLGGMGAAWALLGTGVLGAMGLCFAVRSQVPGCVPVGTLVRSVIAAWVSTVVVRDLIDSSVGGVFAGIVSVLLVNLLCIALMGEWSRKYRVP